MSPDDWKDTASTVVFTSPLNLDYLADFDRSVRVLDLGCGYGRHFEALRAVGFIEIIGYDRSPALVERGLDENPINDLRVGDATSIPEEDASCGLVVLAGLLTTMPSPLARAQVASEIRRVLAPGGRVLGVEFVRSGSRRYDEHGCFVSSAGVRMQHFEPGQISELFTGIGPASHRIVNTSSLSGVPEQVIQFCCSLAA